MLQVTLVAAFPGLAATALVGAPRSGVAGWWAAGAFATLAVALSVVWLPDLLDQDLPNWGEDLGLVVLLAFPYLLLRFTATFRALPRASELVAAVAAVVAAVAILAPGLLPEVVALLVALGYWTGVSLITVVRLWRAGGGQPGVARRRMRLMAAATAVLAAAVISAIQLGDVPVMELVAHLLALASAVGFGLGLSPPRSLRLTWRHTEEEELQRAMVALLGAGTADEVAGHLLPPAVRILGAGGAALVGSDGRVAASHGRAPEVGTSLGEVEHDTGTGEHEVASLGEQAGQLVVWTSAYTPFFGREERGLFQSMAATAGLALERAALLADERAQRAELEKASEQAQVARREAEGARADADAANLAKSEFLSRMSHELRTPLNAVLGFGQLLEVSDLDEEDRDSVHHILKAGRHLLALIDDVLDLSRVEAGTLTISPEPVHAGELVTDSIALVRPLATPRSIQITTDAGACEDYVVADRQRCRQVLVNLLSNAVKYNHDDGRVEVACNRIDEHTLRLAVRDTGPGIDPARQQRLFQPFDRLGAEGSTVEGTGLGLALSKQLVERLGGTIGFDTAPGRGSTFWIDLPRTEAPAAVGDTPVVAGPIIGDNRQLLLVEDNLANLRLVEAMLRRHRPGVSVLPAMQGTIALELAYEHQPDLIVLDLHLPDLSGHQVLDRLTADPRTRDIPVVIASADATPGTIRRLRERGAVDYLTKPLDLQQFLAAVDTALASRS